MGYKIIIRHIPSSDQLGANGREVIIVMIGEMKSWIPTSAGTIGNAFSNAGWSLSLDDGVKIDWASGSVQIRASVFNNFSDQQIVDNASKILSQFYTINEIAVATVRPADIYNVPGEKQVSTIYGKTTVINTKDSKIAKTNGGNNTGGNNTGGNNTGAGDEKGFADYISDFFNSIGNGLGITTPVVLAGLLVVTVVVLKD